MTADETPERKRGRPPKPPAPPPHTQRCLTARSAHKVRLAQAVSHALQSVYPRPPRQTDKAKRERSRPPSLGANAALCAALAEAGFWFVLFATMQAEAATPKRQAGKPGPRPAMHHAVLLYDCAIALQQHAQVDARALLSRAASANEFILTPCVRAVLNSLISLGPLLRVADPSSDGATTAPARLLDLERFQVAEGREFRNVARCALTLFEQPHETAHVCGFCGLEFQGP